MQPRLIVILLCAYLCSSLALPAFARDTCEEEAPQMANIQLVSYQDDGYRPLTAEETGAQTGSDQSPDNNDSEYRKSSSSSDDCAREKSLGDPQERGYRPLDNRTTREQQAPAPTYDAYQGNSPGYWQNSPAYPGYYPAPMQSNPYGNTWPGGGYGNMWPGGGYPYRNAPQFLPGYGIMPYSFGGNGSMPY
jgi:hypothetical protein